MTDRRFLIEKWGLVVLGVAAGALAFQKELEAVWWFVVMLGAQR